MSETKKIIAITLAIVAILLLILIYRQDMSSEGTPQSDSSQKTAQPTGPEGGQVPVLSVPDFTNEDGTVDVQKQKAYLFSMTADSPEEEKAAHYQYAVSIAEQSNILNVTSCNMEPLVLEVAEGSDITLRNDGDTDASVSFGPGNSYTVEAQSTTIVNARFEQGQGLYGYGCKIGSSVASGMMVVTP